MAGLMEYENGLRASFLEKHVDLLPDTFCPFLMNRLSEDILRQIESYFRNDTKVKELDEHLLSEIMKINKACAPELAPVSMKDNIEGYMECLDGYSEIHKNLISILSNSG